MKLIMAHRLSQLAVLVMAGLQLGLGLAIPAPPAWADYCATLMKTGKGLLDEQKINEAQSDFLAATRTCHDSAEAYKYLGITYDQQGHAAEAQRAFQKAITLDPKDAGIHNDLAVSYFRSGNAGAAVKEFEATLRLDPHNVSANGNLAAYHLSQKEFTQAIECLLAAHADQSQDPLLLLELTEANFGAGNHGRAMAAAAKLSQVAGTNPQMLFSLGLALAENGEYQSALTEFSAISETDRDAAVYMNLGTAFGKLGRFGEAKDAYAKAIRLDPSNSEPYLQIGLNALQARSLDEAESWLGKAHEKSPARADITQALAEALMQGKHFDAARDLLTAALQHPPRDPVILQGIGDLHFYQHQDQEALVAYQQCLALDPRRVDSRLALARLYERQHRSGDEKGEYQRVLDIDPDNPAAHAGLGHLALQSGSLDVAAKELRLALAVDANDLAAIEDLALIEFRQEAFDEALALYTKLVTLNPNNPSYHYQLGQTLLKLGHKEDAQREFTRSQELKASASNRTG